MRCENCKKSKQLCMKCKYCECDYCSRCIQLEIHKCPNLTEYSKDIRLVKVVAPKIQKI